MSSWITFVIGVILGLLAGWVIDLLYRRRRDAQPEVEPAATRAPEWSQPLSETPGETAVPVPSAAAGVAGGVVAAAVIDESSGPTPAEEAAAAAPGETVAELAANEPESPQAVSLAVAPEAEGLAEVAPEQEPSWPEVSERAAEVAEPAEEPFAAATSAAAPHIADELPPAEEAPPTAGTGLPPAAVAALAASVAERGDVERGAGARDKLILIEGIGPVYEKKLNDAGIYTFRDLMAAGGDRLREIVQPASWQRVNFAEWIEQAQLLDEGRDEELKELQARLFRRKAG